MRTRGHHRQLRRKPVVGQGRGERIAHVVHEDHARHSIEPRLPILRIGDCRVQDFFHRRQKFIFQRLVLRGEVEEGNVHRGLIPWPILALHPRGPSFERPPRQHPRRMLPRVADTDAVLGVPEFTAVATHFGIDGVVTPLDLGPFGHATNLASWSVSR